MRGVSGLHSIIKYDRFIGNFYFFFFVCGFWSLMEKARQSEIHPASFYSWLITHTHLKPLPSCSREERKRKYEGQGFFFLPYGETPVCAGNVHERLDHWRSLWAVIMLRWHCFTPIIHSIAPQLHSSPAVTQFHLGSPVVSSVRVSPLDPAGKIDSLL